MDALGDRKINKQICKDKATDQETIKQKQNRKYEKRRNKFTKKSKSTSCRNPLARCK